MGIPFDNCVRDIMRFPVRWVLNVTHLILFGFKLKDQINYLRIKTYLMGEMWFKVEKLEKRRF